jgi:hypothetical protein
MRRDEKTPGGDTSSDRAVPLDPTEVDMCFFEMETPLDAKIQEAARLLPDSWAADRDDHGFLCIAGPGGMRLRFESSTANPERCPGYVAGELPGDDRLPVDQLLQATLFLDLDGSSPSVIARDIVHDLLPRYVPLFERLAEQYRERVARQRRKNLARQVRRRLPGGVDAWVRGHDETRVSLGMTVTEAQAEAVFEALRTCR